MPFYETPPFFHIVAIHFPPTDEGEPSFSDDIVLNGLVVITAAYALGSATWFNTTGAQFAAALKASRGYGLVRPREVTGEGFTDINYQADPYPDPTGYDAPWLQLSHTEGSLSANFTATDISGRLLGVIGNRSVTFGQIIVEALPEDYENYPVWGAAQPEIIYEPIEIVDITYNNGIGGAFTPDRALVRVRFHAESEQVTE